ncbi:hypothetical protein JCM11641_006016 [Rhodosporidiobolus odoratus]
MDSIRAIYSSLHSQTSTLSAFTLYFALTVSLVSISTTWFISHKKHFQPQGKHCYIGGGSEGLGLSLAYQLAERGAHVTIISRSEAKLQKALAEIETHRQSPSQVFRYFSCDLTSSSDAAETLHKACADHPSGPAPDFVFACAGGSVPGLFTDMDADKHWDCMEWNFRTCLNTVHEAVRAMKEAQKEGGKVVLAASVLAMMSFYGYSSYSPSKYAIRGLAEALRSELQAYGISTHLFLPATIYSPGYEAEMRTKPEITKRIEAGDEGKMPDDVAKEMITGLERNDFYITYEFAGHMLRNSRAITPCNNILSDTFWQVIGTIAFPVWRYMGPDAEVRQEAKRLRAERQGKTA